MLYIVEMALAAGHTDADWNQWTTDMKSAELLMTVPGFLSAQRFKGITDPLAYCAVYGIRDAGVMSGPAYKGVGGGVRVQQWNSHIIYWNRDILQGISVPPCVADGYALVVRNAESFDFPDGGVPFVRLKVTGLNQSVPFKGIAVLPEEEALRAAGNDAGIRLYRPIAPQLINLNDR